MNNKNKFKKAINVFGIILFLVLIVFVLASDVVIAPIQESQNQQAEYFKVLQVFDGDTLLVQMGDKVESVRAIGIDAPETGQKYTSKECFGGEAKQKAVELLSGKKVKLESDSTQSDRDQYDRLLRYVYLEDGTFFNLAMIQEGFAKEYTFKDFQYEFQSDFLTMQNYAQRDGRGLWGVCKER